ncbi:MAG: hypothetical protein JO362_14385 [Streptomycetaceae bacterium]|nr:hypothetical protein [Streptomycetaceae bacterium]
MTDDEVRRVTALVRSYLPELLGPKAERLDRELALVLNDSSGVNGSRGPDAADALMSLLIGESAVHRWVAAVLESPELLPPQVRRARDRQYQELPGAGEQVPSERFRCPAGDDYEWYRMSLAQPVKECPTHHVLLIPA